MQLKEIGFAIEVEILSKHLRTNNEIVEVPIKYEAKTYDQGKKIKINDAITIFKIIYYSRFNLFLNKLIFINKE